MRNQVKVGSWEKPISESQILPSTRTSTLVENLGRPSAVTQVCPCPSLVVGSPTVEAMWRRLWGQRLAQREKIHERRLDIRNMERPFFTVFNRHL